jgi:epidermal growth factor receptor substrate 15
LIAYALNDTGAGSTFGFPASFNAITPLATSSADGQNFCAAYKADASGSEGTLTITEGNGIIGGIIACSGVDNVTPLDVAAVPGSSVASAASPSTIVFNITPTTSGCLIVVAIGGDINASADVAFSIATTSGTTGSWTQRQDLSNGFFNGAIFTALQSTAGAISITVTCTSAAASIDRAGVVYALRPAVQIPTITVQPSQQSTTNGTTATFSLTANSNGGTGLSYQWYSAPITTFLANVPGTWASISGATSSSYTTATLTSADDGKWFYCVVTDSNGTVNSSTARLFLNDTAPDGIGAEGYPGFSSWIFRSRLRQHGLGFALNKQQITYGRNPGIEEQIFKVWFLGTTTYTDGVTETGTLADSQSATLTGGGPTTYNDSVSEAATASETSSSVAIFASSITEAASASDSRTAIATFASTITEVGTASDSTSAQATFASTVAEAASASDSETAQAAFASSISEAVTVSDAQTSIASFVSTINESVTLAESNSASLSTTSTISESATLADSVSGGITFADSVIETATLAESTIGIAGVGVVITETATASDSTSALLSFASFITESATATDSISALASFSVIIAETVILQDSITANSIFSAAISELANLNEDISAAQEYSVSVSESVNLDDLYGVYSEVSISESVDLIDICSAILVIALPDLQYPLAGQRQTYSLNGRRQEYPLEGQRQDYPLED